MAKNCKMISDASLIIISNSADETQQLGRCLGASVTCGDVIALYGDLGSGKTCFVQGLAQGMAVHGRVSSPTFIVMRRHPSEHGGCALCHVDAYRLENGDELWEMGLEDWLETGAVAVEWSERVADALPEDRMEVHFTGQCDQRELTVTASGPRSRQLLEHLRRCAS